MILPEARCSNCNRKLGENVNVGARIKCPRCDVVEIIRVQSSGGVETPLPNQFVMV